jgi:hypothetical protein
MLKISVGVLLLVPCAAFAQQACPAGKVITEDTRGQCCWPGQAWSSTRSVCVGVPQCPVGYAVGESDCIPAGAASVAPPPAAQPPAPGVTPPPLTGDDRLLKHMHLSQELSDLNRRADDNHWITDYVVGGSVGLGLVLLGYGLNVIFLSVLPADAAGYAAFWTFFGCSLGGAITFTVLAIVGTVKLIRWIALRAQIGAKTEELQQFDKANNIQAPPPAETLWRGPQPQLVVARF